MSSSVASSGSVASDTQRLYAELHNLYDKNFELMNQAKRLGLMEQIREISIPLFNELKKYFTDDMLGGTSRLCIKDNFFEESRNQSVGRAIEEAKMLFRVLNMHLNSVIVVYKARLNEAKSP